MEHPYDIGGGHSHVVDYQGNVLGHTASGAKTFVAGIIDIEALRQFRTMNLNSNWLTTPRPEGWGFRGSRPGVPVSRPAAPGRTRSV